MDDMGSFRIDVELENPLRAGDRRVVSSVLVDTGAALSCFPTSVLEAMGIARGQRRLFRQADGSVLERWTGAAFIYVAGSTTSDDVVFAEPGDLVRLGSRSLAGLNLRIDPIAKQLTDAGPMPLAVVA
jgi:predicted aspartyl protease